MLIANGTTQFVGRAVAGGPTNLIACIGLETSDDTPLLPVLDLRRWMSAWLSASSDSGCVGRSMRRETATESEDADSQADHPHYEGQN